MRTSFFAIALLLVAPAARAEDRDPTTAEALFFAGREAMDRGDYADACPKFAESDRLDPGAGTRINLADCEEHLAHPAAAWRHWREAMELLPSSDERRPIVRERIAQLEPRIPRLTVRMATALKGARLERDGVEIGIVSMGLPLPVEPGEHVVRLTAPGHEDREIQVTLAEGDRRTIAIEPGRAFGPTPPPAAPAQTSVLRPVGIVGIGVSGAALAAGSVFGILAISAKSDLEPNCYPKTVCNDAGAEAASRGRTYATLSTALLTSGAILAVGGIILVATHPKIRAGSAAIVASPGSLRMEGRF